MTDPSADIQLLTLREVVRRRPEMYFGDHPAQDRPLVLMALTAFDLLDYASGDPREVEVTLHSGGAFSGVIHNASLARHAGRRVLAPGELIRRRMWWSQLARVFTVSVRHQGAEVEAVWDELDIAVHIDIDPDVIGVDPAQWWHAAPDRVKDVFGRDFQLQAGHTVVVVDETTRVTTTLVTRS